MNRDTIKGHIMALACTSFWGSAFVVNKLLLELNLASTQIVLCRQSLALFLLWLITVKHLPFTGWQGLKQERDIIFAGMLGASLYYLLEIGALHYSYAANVSLLVTTSPLFSALLERFCPGGNKRAISKRFFLGMIFCLIGAALVIINGNFILKLNPRGDMLALAASASWAGYSFFLNRAIAKNAQTQQPLSPLLLTRRTLFFGLLLIIAVYLVLGQGFSRVIFTPAALLPLLLLAIFPSCSAFLMWGRAIDKIGVIKTSIYVCFCPVVAIIAAALLLDEYMTLFSIAGAVLILLGLGITQGFFGGKRAANADTSA